MTLLGTDKLTDTSL